MSYTTNQWCHQRGYDFYLRKVQLTSKALLVSLCSASYCYQGLLAVVEVVIFSSDACLSIAPFHVPCSVREHVRENNLS